jgi:uncharacterized protein DUF1257
VSKYRKMQTEYSSRAHLREALKASGVPFIECQPGTEEHLYGYHGKRRQETATFIVRREHISSASNDLGWHWNNETRRFEGIVSNYDSTERNTTRIRQTVKREYAASTTMAAARAKGYQVKRVNGEHGEIQLVVTGRVS